jgi:hypothetical protein
MDPGVSRLVLSGISSNKWMRAPSRKAWLQDYHLLAVHGTSSEVPKIGNRLSSQLTSKAYRDGLHVLH